MLSSVTPRQSRVWRRTPCIAHSSSPSTKQVAAAPGNDAARAAHSRRQLLLGATLAASFSSCCPPPAWSEAAAGAAVACPTPTSPVDLPPESAAAGQGAPPEPPLRIGYPRFVKGSVSTNGQGSPQINLPDGAYIELGGEAYGLASITFHAPSEHSFGGLHAAMDAQLLHRNAQTGELVVLVVQLQPGAVLANPILEGALAAAPAQPGAEAPLKPISLLALLPPPRSADGRRPYVTYRGTLPAASAPAGCDEPVRWLVFQDSLRITSGQVLDFQRFVGGGRTLELNAAPQQLLGDRALGVSV